MARKLRSRALDAREMERIAKALERDTVQANENCSCKTKSCARCLDRADFMREILRLAAAFGGNERAEAMLTVSFPVSEGAGA